MIQQISGDIVFLLIKNKYVDIDDREVYTYGLEVLIANILVMFVQLVISLVFGYFVHFILLLMVFVPLRVYFGGYHAKNMLSCTIFSSLMFLTTLVLVKYAHIEYVKVVSIPLVAVSAIIFFVLHPTVHENHNLPEELIKRNWAITRFITVFDVILFVVLYLNMPKAAMSMALFMGFASLLSLLGMRR